LKYTDDDDLTPFGKALQGVDRHYQEPAMAILEMIKLGHLNGDRLITTQNQAPYANEKEIALLTRVFTLGHVETRKGDYKWIGPIDQELMAWNCIMKSHYKTMRNMLEIILTSLYLTDQVKLLDYNQFYKISTRLPFFQENSTALGLILKSQLLEKTSNLHKRFPNCSQIQEDLQKGYAFWTQVFGMVTQLNKDNVLDSQLYSLFISSNSFLEQRTKEEIIKQGDFKPFSAK